MIVMNKIISILSGFVVITILFTFTSCQEEGVVCTCEWVSYDVLVKDSSGNPVVLDDYYTQNTSTGEIIRFKEIYEFTDSLLKTQGLYLLVSDGERHWAKNGYFNIVFKGFIDSTEVVSEKYTVSADVCHINLLKGNTNIIIK